MFSLISSILSKMKRHNLITSASLSTLSHNQISFLKSFSQEDLDKILTLKKCGICFNLETLTPTTKEYIVSRRPQEIITRIKEFRNQSNFQDLLHVGKLLTRCHMDTQHQVQVATEVSEHFKLQIKEIEITLSNALKSFIFELRSPHKSKSDIVHTAIKKLVNKYFYHLILYTVFNQLSNRNLLKYVLEDFHIQLYQASKNNNLHTLNLEILELEEYHHQIQLVLQDLNSTQLLCFQQYVTLSNNKLKEKTAIHQQSIEDIRTKIQQSNLHYQRHFNQKLSLLDQKVGKLSEIDINGNLRKVKERARELRRSSTSEASRVGSYAFYLAQEIESLNKQISHTNHEISVRTELSNYLFSYTKRNRLIKLNQELKRINNIIKNKKSELFETEKIESSIVKSKYTKNFTNLIYLLMFIDDFQQHYECYLIDNNTIFPEIETWITKAECMLSADNIKAVPPPLIFSTSLPSHQKSSEEIYSDVQDELRERLSKRVKL